MGDRNSDNWTRRMYREDKALWELGLESERPQPEVREQGAQKSNVQAPSLPDTSKARQRVADLEQQSGGLEQSVQALTAELEQINTLVAEQERKLKQLKTTALEQKKRLAQKQEEQRKHQIQIETAHRNLAAQEQKRQQAEQQTRDAAAYEQQGYGTYSGQGQGAGIAQHEHNILSRHRETAVSPQARAIPLPGDYLPPAWCYQKLLQHEGIPQDYAQKQLEDFKMYWLSTGEARKAWDYRFVKHVIYQWRREKGKGEERTARSQPTTQELTDRSWADKYDFDFD